MTPRIRRMCLAVAVVALAASIGLAQEMVFRMATFEPNSLDPAVGGPGYQEHQLLYEPLVDAYSKDGEIKMLAAESYEVSDDGRVYTFRLRPNLRWSDGEPVTAEHYRFGWMRMLDPATAAYSPNNLYPIKNAQAYNRGEIDDPALVGVEAVDDLTLRVTLETAAPFFMRSVGRQEYFPIREDILERYGNQWMEAGNFVGNGPYMLVEWLHDQRLVFERNPHYEGPWKDTRHVDRIIYTLLPDPWNTSVPAFEAGEIDVAIVPPGELERVRRSPELSSMLTGLPIAGAVIMVLDTTNSPTDDVRVRQALALAVDYDVLANNVLRGSFSPAVSFSPPDIYSHHPESFLGTDVERAQQLLAEAGYPGGAGFPTFELAYWTVEREAIIAQALQAMWSQNLGINIRLQPYEPAAMTAYRNSRANEPFNAYMGLHWLGLADAHQFHNRLLDPIGGIAHHRYDDPEYVALIRQAITELDDDLRRDLYQQAEALINRDVPILSLIYESRSWLVRPYVENFAESMTALAEMPRIASYPGLRINR